MSSHHIVRDQQEPAVLIHRLDDFPTDTLHALLEWSPLVLCFESSIDLYTQQGHKLDVALVGYSNYEDWKKNLENQHPVKILAVDSTEFVMTALTFLKRDNHKAVNIVSNEASTLSIATQCLQWAPEINTVIITETHRHIIHHAEVYKKWLPPASHVSIRPFSGRAAFTTSGFDENLKNSQISDREQLTKSSEGDVMIQCAVWPFLVSEKL